MEIKDTAAKEAALSTMEKLGIPTDDYDDTFGVELECLIDEFESGEYPDLIHRDDNAYPVLSRIDEKQAGEFLEVLNAYRSEVEYLFERCTAVMRRIAAKHKLECPQTEGAALIAQMTLWLASETSRGKTTRKVYDAISQNL